jgi:F0F1-type ATP synthase assembly protein I
LEKNTTRLTALVGLLSYPQMKKAAGKTTTKRGSASKPDISGTVIALQLLDTGWRVALPILLFTLLGVKFDKAMDTNPLFTIIGLFLAIGVAILLVYRQIQVAYPDFFKKGGQK